MLRLLLLPFLLVGIVLSALASYGWSHFFRERVHPDFDPNLVYSADVEMQRHLASCYEIGCREARPAVILACAWRQIIVEETGAALSSQDLAAADAACARVPETERETLFQVEADIRARIRL